MLNLAYTIEVDERSAIARSLLAEQAFDRVTAAAERMNRSIFSGGSIGAAGATYSAFASSLRAMADAYDNLGRSHRTWSAGQADHARTVQGSTLISQAHSKALDGTAISLAAATRARLESTAAIRDESAALALRSRSIPPPTPSATRISPLAAPLSRPPAPQLFLAPPPPPTLASSAYRDTLRDTTTDLFQTTRAHEGRAAAIRAETQALADYTAQATKTPADATPAHQALHTVGDIAKAVSIYRGATYLYDKFGSSGASSGASAAASGFGGAGGPIYDVSFTAESTAATRAIGESTSALVRYREAGILARTATVELGAAAGETGAAISGLGVVAGIGAASIGVAFAIAAAKAASEARAEAITIRSQSSFVAKQLVGNDYNVGLGQGTGTSSVADIDTIQRASRIRGIDPRLGVQALSALEKNVGSDYSQNLLRRFGLEATGKDQLADPELLAGIARGFESIHDPVQRSKFAIELFKDELGTAAKILPQLNSEFAANIQTVNTWGASIDESGRKKILQFDEGITRLQKNLKQFGQELPRRALGPIVETVLPVVGDSLLDLLPKSERQAARERESQEKIRGYLLKGLANSLTVLSPDENTFLGISRKGGKFAFGQQFEPPPRPDVGQITDRIRSQEILDERSSSQSGLQSKLDDQKKKSEKLVDKIKALQENDDTDAFTRAAIRILDNQLIEATDLERKIQSRLDAAIQVKRDAELTFTTGRQLASAQADLAGSDPRTPKDARPAARVKAQGKLAIYDAENTFNPTTGLQEFHPLAAEARANIERRTEAQLQEARNQKAIERQDDAEAERKSIARFRTERARTLSQSALEAQAKTFGPLGGAVFETFRDAQSKINFIDKEGAQKQQLLTATERLNLQAILQSRILEDAKKATEVTRRNTEEEFHLALNYQSQRYQARQQLIEQTLEEETRAVEQLRAFDESRAGFVRDSRIRAVELNDPKTVTAKVAAEKQKADIEIDFQRAALKARQDLFDDQSRHEVDEKRRALEREFVDAQEIGNHLAALQTTQEEKRKQLAESTDAAIAAARENAVIRSNQIVEQHYRTQFESLKSSANGLLDALFSRNGPNIANFFKAAALTPLKEIASNQIAAGVFRTLHPDVKVGFDNSGDSLLGGKVGGLLGTPTFKATPALLDAPSIKQSVVQEIVKPAQSPFDPVKQEVIQTIIKPAEQTPPDTKQEVIQVIKPITGGLSPIRQDVIQEIVKPNQEILLPVKQDIVQQIVKPQSEILDPVKQDVIPESLRLVKPDAVHEITKPVKQSDAVQDIAAIKYADAVHENTQAVLGLTSALTGGGAAATGGSVGDLPGLIEGLYRRGTSGSSGFSLKQGPNGVSEIISSALMKEAQGGDADNITGMTLRPREVKEFIAKGGPLANALKGIADKTKPVVLYNGNPDEQTVRHERFHAAQLLATQGQDSPFSDAEFARIFGAPESTAKQYKKNFGKQYQLELPAYNFEEGLHSKDFELYLNAIRKKFPTTAHYLADAVDPDMLGEYLKRNPPFEKPAVSALPDRLFRRAPVTDDIGVPGSAGTGFATRQIPQVPYSFSDLSNLVGGPGGTSGFAGPVTLAGGGAVTGQPGGAVQSGGVSSQISSAIGLGKGGFAGLADLFGFGSGPGGTYGSGIIGTGIKGSLKALGGSTAALLGGAALAYDGLKRGGITGLAETTAGGALIGYKYGGPLGAAIGAGVGAIAGGIRLFVKSGWEQVQQQVQDIYQIHLDRGTASQILDIAKQGYHGSISTAIRSSQVLDLLELYAQATGQAFGVRNKPRPVFLSQTAGLLQQQASYVNGQPYAFQGPLSVAGGVQNATPLFENPIGGFSPPRQISPIYTPQQPMNITLQLHPESTAKILQGQAITAIGNSPNSVGDALADSQNASYQRRQAAVRQLEPSTVLG